MNSAPQIETKRLVLTQVHMDDAGDIYQYSRNPNVLRFTTGTPPRNMSDTEDFIRGLLNKPQTSYSWSIRIKSRLAVIGIIEFVITQQDSTVGAVDYGIAEEFWNRGYMTETVTSIIDWAFQTIPSLERITSAAMIANPASTRVQEKCGMKIVRYEKRKWSKFPDPVESAHCEISREAWKAANIDIERDILPLRGKMPLI